MLEVKNLKTEFKNADGATRAVDDVSFRLRQGGSLGIVGESGSGKTLTSLSILRLLQRPGEIVGGQIFFEGRDLLQLSNSEMQQIRGRDITMIFQEPMNSLNPVFTIGEQLESVIGLHHQSLNQKQIRERALQVLRQVNLPTPELKYGHYPHQLSGGMQQRVLIGLAISCQPRLLIADEPTTALDVTIQAQILELLRRLKEELKLSLILITHDLGVISEMCADVVVMYAGQIVEAGPVADVFQNPRHPYTRALLNSVDFKPIPGSVPSMVRQSPGCRFADRCEKQQNLCHQKSPEMRSLSDDRRFACHFPITEGDGE
jgi:oligopeptide/dipeptide ABC transporter ATP-binding protein